MFGDKTFTVEGNLAEDPALDYTPNTKTAVCHLVVITTPRYKDRDSGQWTYPKGTGWRITVWRDVAESICGSLSKGDPVIVTGTEVQKEWEDGDGNKRWSTEMTGESVSVPVRRHQVSVKKLARSSAGNSPSDDPWATQPTR